MGQLERDTKFLTAWNVMDFSLLIGVVNDCDRQEETYWKQFVHSQSVGSFAEGSNSQHATAMPFMTTRGRNATVPSQMFGKLSATMSARMSIFV